MGAEREGPWATRCWAAVTAATRPCPTTTAGRVVGEALAAAGVSHLFFLPGGHLAPVVQGATAAGIRLVGTRHESAAVFMAEAWARCTGEVGVAGVTAGPGFTNAVTGIANSQSTGIPTVVLGGRTPLAPAGQGRGAGLRPGVGGPGRGEVGPHGHDARRRSARSCARRC